MSNYKRASLGFENTQKLNQEVNSTLDNKSVKIYTFTGIFCSLLVVILVVIVIVLMRKRLFSLRSANLTDPEGPVGKKGSVQISNKKQSNSSNPGEKRPREGYPNMIKSHAWFDSLER